jgi:hypothetical protein
MDKAPITKEMSMTSEIAQQTLTDRFAGLFNPLEITADQFKSAYDTSDIAPHIEKDYKGLSYLSWPFAYRYLKQHFPTFFVAFEEKTIGEVVFGGPGAYYVRPYLTDGCRRSVALVFPLMDRKHNACKELDARFISDNCQRAAVKCIATFTGLGLRLYAGEDIPKEEQQASNKTASKPAEVASPSPEKSTESFDGREALLSFCNANPLHFDDTKACQVAVKSALENIGLARGSDIKSTDDYLNVVTTLVSAWTKNNGVKITKAAMTKDLAAIRTAKTEGLEGINNAVAAFYLSKKLTLPQPA